MLRSASGILGTVEVGNGFPRDGTDGEWKIAGREAILTMKDGVVKLATGESDETLPGANITAPAFTALRDASTIGGEARRLRSACTTARGSCG
jgi:hypothetical protein